MPDLRDIIGRGKPFTGRVLLDALEIAGKPPIGGRGLIVSARGSSDAVLNATGFPIIVPRRLKPAILQPAVNFRTDGNGFNVEYRYPWVEAEIDASGLWIPKPMGIASTDPNRTDAVNWAELLNESPAGSGVLYGIPIDAPAMASPEYHINGVFPIPDQQPVPLLEAKIQTTGVLVYYFEAANRINLICGPRGPAAAGALRIPPDGEVLLPEITRRRLAAERMR